MYYMSICILSLPSYISKIILHLNFSKPTLIVSNVFISTSLCICGSNSIKMTSYNPLVDDITGGFAIISHRDILLASFISDVGRCDDGQ